MLTRITIFLTLVSAGLVTIGLLGQATQFDGWFAGAALAILGFLALIGLMTQTRVFNVAEEDLMYVIAMNRLRGAYVDLDPPIERYFLAATADDRLGSERTYSFLRVRNFSHLFGSSFMLIMVVNALRLRPAAVGGGIVAAGGGVGWADRGRHRASGVAADGRVLALRELDLPRGVAHPSAAAHRRRPARTATSPTAPGARTPGPRLRDATGTRRGSRPRSARS